jgi:hypothetical protein
MTKDRARKQDIRARMAASGEPYSVAARQLAGFESAEGSLAARVAARASATLNEPSARMGIHLVIELPGVEIPETPRQQRRGGALGMARRLLGTFVHEGTHVDGEGFAEPAARRYLIDGGPNGSGHLCREGKLVSGRHGWRVRLLQGALGEVSPDPPKRMLTLEVELWDFCVSVAQLDWSRLP